MLTIIPILNEAATPLEQTLCLTVIGRDPNTGDSASSHHCKKAALEEEDCKKTKTYWNARMIELVELFARTADSSPSDAFPSRAMTARFSSWAAARSSSRVLPEFRSLSRRVTVATASAQGRSSLTASDPSCRSSSTMTSSLARFRKMSKTDRIRRRSTASQTPQTPKRPKTAERLQRRRVGGSW